MQPARNTIVPTVEDVEQAVMEAGFTPLGWFHAAPGDGVPDIAAGVEARTLVLIGNAGPQMWQRFATERTEPRLTLDAWSAGVLRALAERLGAGTHFPFDRPALPFQRWAQRSGTVHTSPIGLSIHREYGLWHAYRAAFAFERALSLPARTYETSPCQSCDDRPCLSTCPVDAFTDAAYDVEACAAHLRRPGGADCMDLGCRARRACPVGRAHIYEPAQARFHMTAFLDARQS